MCAVKEEWVSVQLPKPIYERIRIVYLYVGYTSIAEYVRDAVRNALRHHEISLEVMKERAAEDGD